ncbi:MAG: hypothetical protein ACD_15C00210G0001 [uncultured bacterium]|nr:MAG: hypothetical protein ACD_15C00210G0001 [uncultured bacterium]
MTDKKATNMERRKDAQLYCALFEHNPLEIIVVDLEGRIVKYNMAKRNSGDRLPNIGDVMYRDYAGRHKNDMYQEMMECLKSGKTKIFPEQVYGDKILSITIAAFPMGAAITAVDITDLKLAEKKLHQQSQAMEASIDGLAILSAEQKFIYVNGSYAEIYGYDRSELVGKSCHLLYDEEELEKIEDNILLELRNNKCYKGVTRGRKKDGSSFFQEISLTALENDSIVCVVRDITERVMAEKEKQMFEESLRMMDKMRAIVTLAGGFAHNFNNILTVILGNALMAAMSMGKSDPNYYRIKQIEEQVKRGSDLAGQLLGFARVEKYDVKTTDMNYFLGKISRMLAQARKEFSISFHMNDGLYPADIDVGQMEQVLTNLFFNACDAMPGGGDIVLSADNWIIGKDSALPLKPGRYIKISMADRGVGMDDETKKRIFEPFFTTKEIGKGSGLGLATVYGIIKGHEGIIDVFSEPGNGATFSIYLPASNSDVIADKVENRSIAIGSGAILLVDDEQSALSINKEILELMGYRVYTALSGKQAISIYQKRGDMIDLVILDMIMPEMSGRKTFELLQKINPRIKAMLLTGYARNEEAEAIMSQGCCGFFQKPFDASQISREIKRVLDE